MVESFTKSRIFLTGIIYWVLNLGLYAQNLLPNPSFEAVNICQKYQEPCAPKGWRSTVLKNFYYFEYLPGHREAIRPVDGGRTIALTLFFSGKDFERKFLQAPLICPLVKGATYRLTLHYLLEGCIVEHFGAYFPDTLFVFEKNAPLQMVEPQIVFSVPEKTEPYEWQKTSATFMATGMEQGIIIGNFSPDENVRLLPAKGVGKKDFERWRKKRIYYRFDHLLLEPIDPAIHLNCDFEDNLQRIYQDSFRHVRKVLPVHLPRMNEPFKIPKAQIKPLPSPIKDPILIVASDTIPINENFVLGNINFETNSARLLPSAYRSLEAIAEALKLNPTFKLSITGHTDNIGNRFDNQQLSKQRAEEVAAFFIGQGIAPKRLISSGKGESEPIADNETEEGRHQNRRVVFVFIK